MHLLEPWGLASGAAFSWTSGGSGEKLPCSAFSSVLALLSPQRPRRAFVRTGLGICLQAFLSAPPSSCDPGRVGLVSVPWLGGHDQMQALLPLSILP